MTFRSYVWAYVCVHAHVHAGKVLNFLWTCWNLVRRKVRHINQLPTSRISESLAPPQPWGIPEEEFEERWWSRYGNMASSTIIRWGNHKKETSQCIWCPTGMLAYWSNFPLKLAHSSCKRFLRSSPNGKQSETTPQGLRATLEIWAIPWVTRQNFFPLNTRASQTTVWLGSKNRGPCEL